MNIKILPEDIVIIISQYIFFPNVDPYFFRNIMEHQYLCISCRYFYKILRKRIMLIYNMNNKKINLTKKIREINFLYTSFPSSLSIYNYKNIAKLFDHMHINNLYIDLYNSKLLHRDIVAISSLGKIKSLRWLYIDMRYNCIMDDDLLLLKLDGCSNLETLHLDLDIGLGITPDGLNKLLLSLAALQFLKKVFIKINNSGLKYSPKIYNGYRNYMYGIPDNISPGIDKIISNWNFKLSLSIIH